VKTRIVQCVSWQPIATATKDGKPILLWLSSPIDRNYTVSGLCDNICIGFWQHGRWCSIEIQDCGSMGGEETGWMPDWCPLDVDASHWMPLPNAP
jgi:hypothetical protein